jgi:uncharacterized membrane protein
MGFCMMFMMGGHRMPTHRWLGRDHDSALDALNERFARGEIGEAEYRSKREAIMH